MNLIGLCGPAGSGKDEAAKALTACGWERVSFADPLRKMCLAIDPLIEPWNDRGRLSDMVREFGWDKAKQHPEVRRTLQRVGTEAVREVLGSETWVDLAARTIKASLAPGVIITDVRFPNEVAMLRSFAARIFRVRKPGVGPVNGHVSDAMFDQIAVDGFIENDGSIADLHAKLRLIAGVD